MKKELFDWQREYILNNYQGKTAEQLAVKAECPVWQVKAFAEEKNLELRKIPKRNYGKVPGRTVRQFAVEKKVERPPAVYGNMPSPYGIATEARLT